MDNEKIRASLLKGQLLPSRRNKVYSGEYGKQKYVLKTYSSTAARIMEENNLKTLSSLGTNVPVVTACFPDSILMEYIDGRTYAELISLAESGEVSHEELTLASYRLAEWMDGFYRHTGSARGDVNLRNFIYSEDRVCVGIDFEDDFIPGVAETDAGGILAYALSYSPTLTPEKLLFVKSFLKAHEAYDAEMLRKSYCLELNKMLQRRKNFEQIHKELLKHDFLS